MKRGAPLAVLVLNLLLGAGRCTRSPRKPAIPPRDSTTWKCLHAPRQTRMAVLNYERANLLSANDPDLTPI